MSEFSRVKKYENLRNNMESNQKEGMPSKEAPRFNAVPLKEEIYTPTHEKNFSNQCEKNDSDKSDSFKNEYLDSFIQEVRDYNIQKGIRESEDTKLDILQQLTTKNRERRQNYIEKIEDSVSLDMDNVMKNNIDLDGRNEETLEISRQVFDLLNEKVMNDVVPEKLNPMPIAGDNDALNENTPFQENHVENALNEVNLESDVDEVLRAQIEEEDAKSLDERIAQLEGQVRQPQSMRTSEELANLDEDEISTITKQELMEQTMQLKVKIDQYENDLSEINSDVDSNNRLLNIVITVLIVALLIVIGVVVYWLISGGIL